MSLRAIAAAICLTLVSLLPWSAALAGDRPPLGYQVMCLKNPAACRGGGASKVAASEDVMVTLKRVNLSVNRSIRPKSESASKDVWTVNASSGDCEDYAMTKRVRLIKAGLPASALRIAYVKTRAGEDHAVLVVKRAGGDLVLDNLTDSIRPLNKSGLRVISMSSANGANWV